MHTANETQPTGGVEIMQKQYKHLVSFAIYCVEPGTFAINFMREVLIVEIALVSINYQILYETF